MRIIRKVASAIGPAAALMLAGGANWRVP